MENNLQTVDTVIKCFYYLRQDFINKYAIKNK